MPPSLRFSSQKIFCVIFSFRAVIWSIRQARSWSSQDDQIAPDWFSTEKSSFGDLFRTSPPKKIFFRHNKTFLNRFLWFLESRVGDRWISYTWRQLHRPQWKTQSPLPKWPASFHQRTVRPVLSLKNNQTNWDGYCSANLCRALEASHHA